MKEHFAKLIQIDHCVNRERIGFCPFNKNAKHKALILQFCCEFLISLTSYLHGASSRSFTMSLFMGVGLALTNNDSYSTMVPWYHGTMVQCTMVLIHKFIMSMV